MTNRTGARVLVVLSVDGINAISGETAAVNQTGYVLAPYASAEITGWRKSMTEAAAFYFTSLADSYAARTDRPDNVGVIGVAIYRERAPPEPRLEPPWSSSSRESEARAMRLEAPGPAARPSPAAEPAPSTDARAERVPRRNRRRREAACGLGGQAGPRRSASAPAMASASMRRSRTPRSSAPADQPNEIVRVRYDSHANLVAMGVIRAPELPFEPQPFARFAPDPR